MRRTLAIALGTLCAALTLAACGSDSSGPSISDTQEGVLAADANAASAIVAAKDALPKAFQQPLDDAATAATSVREAIGEGTGELSDASRTQLETAEKQLQDASSQLQKQASAAPSSAKSALDNAVSTINDLVGRIQDALG